jgi:sulfur carrier protein
VKIVVNDVEREVAVGITVARLLSELELSGRHLAVEVNLELVPRGRHAEFVLHAGDRLEIVTFVGGG